MAYVGEVPLDMSKDNINEERAGRVLIIRAVYMILWRSIVVRSRVLWRELLSMERGYALYVIGQRNVLLRQTIFFDEHN